MSQNLEAFLDELKAIPGLTEEQKAGVDKLKRTDIEHMAADWLLMAFDRNTGNRFVGKSYFIRRKYK